MQERFNKLKQVWNHYGKTEPHWSVLTNHKYTPSEINKNIKQFYQSGEIDIKYFESILQKHNHTLTDKIILDFGCGVGRLTKACLQYSNEVYGIDISESHLEIAKKNASQAKYFSCNSSTKLPQLPNNPEVIISFMVLQHIPTRLMKQQIISLLNILKSKGVAVLQIPFKIDSSVVNNENTMEMYSLSVSEVEHLVTNSKCTMLEKIPSNASGEKCPGFIYLIKKM